MSEDFFGRERELDMVVSDVKDFIKSLNRSLHNGEVFEIQHLYEEQFLTLTERFFKGSPWPSTEAVKHADIIDSDDVNFLILYKELYFRHIYSKLTPSVSDRFDSFLNYTNLFNILLGLNTQKPELELPAVWLWDIVDEFIYQFRTFHALRANLDTGGVSDSDIKRLKEAPHLWSAQTVCAYLDRLITKGSEENAHPFFKTLCEYCTIGASRVMCLMGDYYSALEKVDKLDFEALKSAKTIAPFASLSYHVAFSYLMLRRYTDAITVASNLLIFVRRLRMEEDVPKAVFQLHGIIALARSQAPQSLDDGVASSLWDVFGERAKQLSRNKDLCKNIFEEVAPKFITACVPDYDSPSHYDATQVQANVFVSQVHQHERELDSMLKLCSTISESELCTMANQDPSELASGLISAKIKNKTLTRNRGDSASEGTCKLSSPVHFFVKDNYVHVAQNPTVDRYGDYFMGQFLQFDYMLQEIRGMNRG